MAEALGVAASVVGLVVPALHGVRLLLDDVRNIHDAPESLRSLRSDLDLADRALESLKDIQDAQWTFLGEAVAGHATATIGSCSEACTSFRNELQKWTKRSKDGKLSWLDRGNLGFFKQTQIKSMSQQLQNCHTMITSMVSTATLHGSLRNSEVSERIEKMLSQSQAQLNNWIAVANSRLAEVEGAVGNLPQQGEQPQQETPAADVLAQIREEGRALEASRQLLQDLLERTREVVAESRPEKGRGDGVKATFGYNYQGLQMAVNKGTMSNLRFGGS